MIKVTVTDSNGAVIDEISFDHENIFHHEGATAIVSRDIMKGCDRADLWYRVAHAAAWVAETGSALDALLAIDSIQLLRQRLETGWQPRAGDLDRDVQQIDALNWSWADDGRAIAYLTIDRQPRVSGEIIYVDRHLTHALTAAGLLWLYDDEESEKIRFLGD